MDRLTYNPKTREYVVFSDDIQKATSVGLTLSKSTFGPNGERCWFTSTAYAALPYFEAADERAKSKLASMYADYKQSWRIDWDGAPFPCPPKDPQGKPLAFMPYQNAGIKWGIDRPNVLIADEPGLGKAQPLDARVRTPTGWVRIGDLKVGDGISGYDGRGGRVTAVYDRGEMDVYEITFSDGSTVRASEDHLWRVKTPKGPWCVMPTWRVADAMRRTKVWIPQTAPVGGQAGAPRLDPYLMGLLLGDGGLTHNSPRLTSCDLEIVEFCARWAAAHKLKLTQDGISYTFSGGRVSAENPLTKQLRYYGVWGLRSGDKFVPPRYMTGSTKQRLSVLQGLMDSDGWIGKNAVCGFLSKSEQLAKDVVDLVQSLGGTARLTQKRTGFWNVTINSPMNPFRLGRKRRQWRPFQKYAPRRLFKKIRFVGREPVRCIAVTTAERLYLTDGYVVTHNTGQAIGIANAKKMERVLVICPANIRMNWRREVLKWSTIPSPRSYPVTKAADGISPSANFVMISYELCRNEALHAALYDLKWDMIVVDEAHYLKDKGAGRTQAVFGGGRKGEFSKRALVDKADKVVCLTGTPLPNRPRECFTIASALHPESIDWMNFDEFTYRFNPSGRMENHSTGTMFNREEKGRLPELQARLRSNFMIRRLKKEVLKDLPDKRYELTYVEPTGAINEIIARERMLDFSIEDLSDPFAEIWGQISTIRREMGEAKLPRAVEHLKFLLDVMEVPKVVVFSHHRSVMDRLFEAMSDYGIVQLRGGMSVGAKMKSIDSFVNDPKVRIFSGQMESAGVGIDGLQNVCTHCVVIEASWVPGVNEQAVDRLHRNGQHGNVIAQFLVVEGSLDERVLAAVLDKTDTIHNSLDADHTVNEVAELFPV